MTDCEFDLEDFLDKRNVLDTIDPTVCSQCSSRTEESGNSLICTKCGYIMGSADQLEEQEKSSSAIIQVGNRTYNIGHNNVDTRKKEILEYLNKAVEIYMRAEQFEPVPSYVISTVATRYAEIQQRNYDHDTDPFIHRGSVRKKILAALLIDEANKQGCERKKDVITKMLDLPTNGFAEGEKVLRALANKGIITLSDQNDTKGFAERYLTPLDLNSEENVNFVESIVQTSYDCNMEMASQRSSKIVGAIWLLIRSKRLNITIYEVEQASEKTRVNTFKRFYDEVMRNKSYFTDVFKEFNMDFPPSDQR